jgi:uncharacterized ubiquitin-like protein YukD
MGEGERQKGGSEEMSSLPVDFNMEKMEYLMNKLDLHLLTKDEARELVPLVEQTRKLAINTGNKEHEEIWSGLLTLLDDYIQGKYNLYIPQSISVSNI